MYSYAVVFLLLLSAIDATYAQASINCSNLTSVCVNTPIILTCKTSRFSGVKWKSDLFDESLPFYEKDITANNIGKEIKSDDNNFVATILRIDGNTVLTSLTFNFDCSYEDHVVKCLDTKNNDYVDSCIINYTYTRIPLAPTILNSSIMRTRISLHWSFDETIKVEHLSLSIKPAPSKGNCKGGNCNMSGVKNKFIVTDLESNTKYTVSLEVKNCAGHAITDHQVTTKHSALDPPTELCACVISQATSSTITVEAHWNCSQSDKTMKKINYYLIKMFNKNYKLVHLQYQKTTSCGGNKRHIIQLPNDGKYTFQVSAISKNEESRPSSKEIDFTSAYSLSIETPIVSTSDKTVQCLCCVRDVHILSIHDNVTCIIKLEENRFEGKSQFAGGKCVQVTIPVNSERIHYYKKFKISYIAFFEYDPNKCYGTRGIIYISGADKALLITPASLSCIVIGFIINTIV